MGQASPSRIYLVLAVAASAALGGCGRRGPLELPPGAPSQGVQDTTALADKQAAAFNEAAPPGVIQSPDQVVQIDKTSAELAAQKPSRAINAPRQAKPSTFLLDPLL